MGKLPDLDAFNRRQIVGGRRRGHSIFEIVRQLGISRWTLSRVYHEYMDYVQKTSDRENCKGQLALTVCGDRLLRSIPSKSPDLNPIEQTCDVLEQDLKGHHTAPTNLTKLWTALANIRPFFPVERFRKLVEYMLRRVAAIIKARRGPSRY
ncbi:transposable element Tcb2 transposase [Trichonephila clavipes]|nr:transposable element Tcb2 transposase [Trichonephila clavipes]